MHLAAALWPVTSAKPYGQLAHLAHLANKMRALRPLHATQAGGSCIAGRIEFQGVLTRTFGKDIRGLVQGGSQP